MNIVQRQGAARGSSGASGKRASNAQPPDLGNKGKLRAGHIPWYNEGGMS